MSIFTNRDRYQVRFKYPGVKVRYKVTGGLRSREIGDHRILHKEADWQVWPLLEWPCFP